MGTKENAALVRELYGTLMANGDVTTAERILAPDYVDHDVPGPFPGTREGLIVDLPAWPGLPWGGEGGLAMKEVTCMCGWQTRGTDDEVVAAIQQHGDEAHGQRPTREEILALAVDLGEAAGDARTA